jgi:hypothetical protein
VEYYFIIFLITAFRNFTFNSAENSTNFSFQLNSKNRKIIKLQLGLLDNSYFPSSAMFQQTFTFGSFLKIFTMMLIAVFPEMCFFIQGTSVYSGRWIYSSTENRRNHEASSRRHPCGMRIDPDRHNCWDFDFSATIRWLRTLGKSTGEVVTLRDNELYDVWWGKSTSKSAQSDKVLRRQPTATSTFHWPCR